MQTLKTTTLTKWERLNFANQYKILKEAHKNDEYLTKYYDRLEDIFKRGYVELYTEAITEIWEELPEHISNEVVDILLMHRALLWSLGQTPDPANVERVKFKGFDHLHEPKYLGYAKFLVSDGEHFEELRVFNSHCPTLPRYRKMLAEWNKLDRNMQLSKEQIEAILEAGTFRHND